MITLLLQESRNTIAKAASILERCEVTMAGVGTQNVFENERVIVWHLDLEPGEHGERHTSRDLSRIPLGTRPPLSNSSPEPCSHFC